MTDEEKGEPDYKIGYKRTPEHSRFRKGHKGYPRRKARAGSKAQSSMTEAVSKKVRTRDPKGKRRSATVQEVIDSNLAAKAAKGDLRAVALVHRQLERERASAVSNSPRVGSVGVGGEKPRRNYSQIMFDFAKDMWEETYQMLLEEDRKHITDGDCRDGALKFIIENHLEFKQRYASEFNYRIFIYMIAAIGGYKSKHITISRHDGDITF